MVNDKIRIFPAICVPTIHVTPCVEGVGELVKVFDQKRIELADIFLRENPTKKFDIVFGVDAFHLLPTQTQVFGNKNCCVLSSEIGVLPIGNCLNFLNNATELNKDFFSQKITENPEHANCYAVSTDLECEKNDGTIHEINNFFISCDSTLTPLETEEFLSSCKPNDLGVECAKILNYDNYCYEENISDTDLDSCKKTFE